MWPVLNPRATADLQWFGHEAREFRLALVVFGGHPERLVSDFLSHGDVCPDGSASSVNGGRLNIHDQDQNLLL